MAGAQRLIERDTLEFGRIANLSDGVFAIAMTLLVLGIEVPDPSVAAMSEQLRDRLPNVIAFVLGFGLVGNVWWTHHKFVGQLAAFDPGLLRLNLTFLGVVALAPFPTGMVGSAPTDRWAVIPFIVLFVVLIALTVAMVGRAHANGLWRWPLSPALYRWVRLSWLAALGGMAAAALVALASPVAGLSVAALSGAFVEPLIARRAPRGYAERS
jgi:uncharacterized membrane protein